MGFLDRSRIVAPPGYSRWLIPPAALAVHLSIGQVYAFSVFKTPLQEHFGTAGTPISIIFSIAIVMLGLSAAVLGKWVERVGPRKTMFFSGLLWTSGFLVSAIGIALDQLWLMYLGYGVLGGIGLGIGYISPVSTLIKWFPDRPGLATGLAIMGFGGGALIAAPLSESLLSAFSDSIAPCFLVLGGIYLVAMMLGALTIRVPADDWKPEGYTPPEEDSDAMQTSHDVSASSALKTPQFWLLWTVLFCNVTAGIGIIEQAEPMISDFFPEVAAAAAAGYVGLLSLANMAGRFAWSATSDRVGRKPIYMLYLGAGAGLYLFLAAAGSSALALFVLASAIIISFYGGGFATIPAYLKDLFGGAQVGAIHGRLLTAWSAAGVAGPLIVNLVVDSQEAAGAKGADLYQLSLYIMVGVLIVGFIANLMVRPVKERFWMERAKDERGSESESDESKGQPRVGRPQEA
ncbi:OFA family MFS transporter [Thermoleophilia bacterium SCSIO 60948]|nr:OFA family MFS transporter [Thermoleophilia bacterium SCSIO 60948]